MNRYDAIKALIEPGEHLEIWKEGKRVYLYGRSEWLRGPEKRSCVNIVVNKNGTISKKGAKSWKTRG